jgi:hypothetical protein|tara:strand:- start:11426 stop:11743 length:318 start_codon:yes stop_codon:yes gene_type:complete
MALSGFEIAMGGVTSIPVLGGLIFLGFKAFGEKNLDASKLKPKKPAAAAKKDPATTEKKPAAAAKKDPVSAEKKPAAAAKKDPASAEKKTAPATEKASNKDEPKG